MLEAPLYLAQRNFISADIIDIGLHSLLMAAMVCTAGNEERNEVALMATAAILPVRTGLALNRSSFDYRNRT